MAEFRIEDIVVRLDHGGDRHFNRAGLVDWSGLPVQIISGVYTFHFDLEGRIHRIDGFPSPYSWDWIQRTMANEWIYYDRAWAPGRLPQPAEIVGDVVWAVNGRCDPPMLHRHEGLRGSHVRTAIDAFDGLIASIRRILENRPPAFPEPGFEPDEAAARRLWAFLEKAAIHDRGQLQAVADRLHEIHGHMEVLPPETIGVDYQVLLVKLMDGCANTCAFCSVRGDSEFAVRSRENVDWQIDALAELYGDDLYNYNSVVFGECDAMASPWIEYAARRAFDVFRCGSSYHAGSNLFLFATNRNFLEQPDGFFDRLESLPFECVGINVGWEAATDDALARLGKRQTAGDVLCGMNRAGSINRKRGKVRVSGNFITADEYDCHGIVEAIGKTGFEGQLYLSPLHGQCSGAKALGDLQAVRKAAPGVCARLYTMQRL